MPTTTITKTVEAPAADVWCLLENFSDVSWIPPAGEVKVEGSGPGMRRSISGSGGPPVVEELVGIDAVRRTIRYRIVENNPLPLTEQDVTTTVADLGATSTVDFDIRFTLADKGGDEAAAVASMEAIYSMMAGWLGDAASA